MTSKTNAEKKGTTRVAPPRSKTPITAVTRTASTTRNAIKQAPRTATLPRQRKPVVAKVEKNAAKSLPKIKLIRDSFTLPEPDHELIKQCKKAAITSGRETKKSEVVRAAIRAFSELPIAQQIAAYDKLQAIAVGRPKAK